MSLISNFGQNLTLVNPEAVGISQERLARIGELIDSHIDSGFVSGAVSMVARKRNTHEEGCPVPNVFNDQAHYCYCHYDAL